MLSKYSVKGLMILIYPVLKDWGLGWKKKKSYGGNSRLGLEIGYTKQKETTKY